MGKHIKLGLLAGVIVLGLVAAAGATIASHQATNTLVFAGSSDPVLMDPSLVSDGESLRATDQIFESLVGFKLGGTTLVPELATSWKTSKNGLVYTFALRKNVKFSDGTPFNAKAVCYNYDRWYNFPGPLQNSAVSYYYNTVFGGFAHPAKGNPGPSKALYRSCKAKGSTTAVITLRHPSGSFLNTISLPNFGIASPAALKKYKANAGTVDKDGVFHPSGTFATRNPVGTGAYTLRAWTPGTKLELNANPKYWGKKAKLTRVIIRPISDNAARLQALQSGDVQGYDNVAPEDYATIRNNSKLQLLTRPVAAVGYVGINQAVKPLDNPQVRQAIAYGLDRDSVVKSFYGGQGKVANQFLPPAISGFASSGIPDYPYNPTKAKALLQAAGLTLPVSIKFAYPTNVSRPYMPDPKKNAEAFGASLEKSGFKVTFESGPWRPDYLAAAQSGKYQLFLLGWIADYFDPADFLNIHFGAVSPQFGFDNKALFAELAAADRNPDQKARIAAYQKASVDVMKFLPVVPYVWASSPVALSKNVSGYVTSPLGPINEPYSHVSVK